MPPIIIAICYGFERLIWLAKRDVWFISEMIILFQKAEYVMLY